MSGNIAEWVQDDDGTGVAVGGSYRSTAAGLCCDAVDPSKDLAQRYEDVGFRCCK